MTELTEDEQASAEGYDAVFTGISRDSLIQDLFREAYGEEYPEGVGIFSSWTRGTLARAASALRLKADDLLADLGCGVGGPGQWLARENGTRLIGVDISQAAISAAADAASRILEADRFDYRRGSFNDTGLADESVDAVVSADAMRFARDHAGALVELRRVMRPGARAFFTTSEWRGDSEPPLARMATDWPDLIAKAGLTLVDASADRDRGPRWLRVYRLWLDHEAELRDRLGGAAQHLIDEANSGMRNLTSDFVGMEYVVERHGD